MKKNNQNSVVLRSLIGSVLLSLLILLQSGCVKQYTNQPLPNKSPQTFFWLYPSDTSIALGISKQELRWWGEDPDGYVVGYLLAVSPDLVLIPNPDTLTYTYVTTTDSVLSFPLRAAQQSFLVTVHAVDNTMKYPLRVGAKIKLSPFPYWDINSDGIFNSTDIRLDNLLNSIDVNGAKQRFPTKNSPPTINYVLDDADNSVFAEPPPITFTVASFSWIGHDFDGDETIQSYRISLNDSTFANPLVVSSAVTTITLSVPRGMSDTATTSTVNADVLFGTSPNIRKIGVLTGLRLDANNALYVQAVDVANAASKFLPFPSASGKTWHVTKPRGTFLIVNDYLENPIVQVIRPFYTDSVFSKVGISYDILDIRSGATATRSYGLNVPAKQHLNPALIETYKLFKCVFWYADGTPSLEIARKTLYNYWSLEGGRLIFSSDFVDPNALPDAGHAFRDIAPLDSLGTTPLSVTRFTGFVNPDSSFSQNFPIMVFNNQKRIPIVVYPLYSNAAAQSIYYLPTIGSYPLTSIGVIDDTRHVIFFNIPLYSLLATDPKDSFGNNGGVVGFFKKAFTLFGIQ